MLESQEYTMPSLGTEARGRHPVVAEFKAVPPFVRRVESPEIHEENILGALQQFTADKGYDPRAILVLAQAQKFSRLFYNYVLRHDTEPKWSGFDLDRFLVTNAETFTQLPPPKYTGSEIENEIIDSSIAAGLVTSERRAAAGKGATQNYGSDPYHFLGRVLGDTNITILGSGAAGRVARAALSSAGFDAANIRIIDQAGSTGIWAQKNVAGGSRNNPRSIRMDRYTLDAAPGPGQSIVDFLDEINGTPDSLFTSRLVNGIVTGVQPGDLEHHVIYRNKDGEQTISSPIVINALGRTDPLNPNREGYMTTDTPREAGIRWQQMLEPGSERAERYRGKRVIFIGLGNSTAEMLVQVQKLNKLGYNIDYRVLTHYPAEAVANPDSYITDEHGKRHRVFRDLEKTQLDLTSYEGDLEEAREAYMTAFRDEKIIPDVTHWHTEDIPGATRNDAEKKQISITTKQGQLDPIDFFQQYTLIGYGQNPEKLRAMGLTVTDEYLGAIAYQYDGEVQRQLDVAGREGVDPGYYVLGAIARTDINRNAAVMPGMMHRMYDMTFSAVLRALEHKINTQGYDRVLEQLLNNFGPGIGMSG